MNLIAVLTLQDSSCPAWKQSEAALALAQLHIDAGDTLAAQQVLSILKQPAEAADGAEQADGDAGQQTQTLFHRAGLMLRLGQQVGSPRLNMAVQYMFAIC